ncbi:hypothetical protein M422DRAFT_779672 [Sphaerobolus stellatus SS14]|uniref:Uncharacterized protein n=1 Tax=Sphaerobolus stellatus (strain SS14) TaxID=990650 RepID=A0A0C9ULC9_SPHS4|nr:hypothetical protein M422DRAFT_779672 [Sphaerobolus stellatus SS14]
MPLLKKSLKKLTRFLPSKKGHSRPVAVVEHQGLGSIPYQSYPSSGKIGLSDYDVVEFTLLVWDDEVSSSCSSSPSSSEESLVVAGNDFVVDTVIGDRASLSTLSGSSSIAFAPASSGLCSHLVPYQFGKTSAGKFKRSNVNTAQRSANITFPLSHDAPQPSSSVCENTVDLPAEDGKPVETTRNKMSTRIVTELAQASNGLSTIHPTPYQFGKFSAARFQHGRTNKGNYEAPSQLSHTNGALSTDSQHSLIIPHNTIVPRASIPSASVEWPSEPLPLLRFETGSSCDSTDLIKVHPQPSESISPAQTIPTINVWSPGPDPFLVWSSDPNAHVDLSHLLPPPDASKEEAHRAYLEFCTFVPVTSRFGNGPTMSKRHSKRGQNTKRTPPGKAVPSLASEFLHPSSAAQILLETPKTSLNFQRKPNSSKPNGIMPGCRLGEIVDSNLFLWTMLMSTDV